MSALMRLFVMIPHLRAQSLELGVMQEEIGCQIRRPRRHGLSLLPHGRGGRHLRSVKSRTSVTMSVRATVPGRAMATVRKVIGMTHGARVTVGKAVDAEGRGDPAIGTAVLDPILVDGLKVGRRDRLVITSR